jgi:Ribbon-helix-helix protein, copG family
MHKISIEKIEQKIDRGEEVVDQYFDPASTRVGKPRPMTSRRQPVVTNTSIEVPSPMLNELDQIAKELDISRQAVIKMMLRRSLDEHHRAKQTAS